MPSTYPFTYGTVTYPFALQATVVVFFVLLILLGVPIIYLLSVSLVWSFVRLRALVL